MLHRLNEGPLISQLGVSEESPALTQLFHHHKLSNLKGGTRGVDKAIRSEWMWGRQVERGGGGEGHESREFKSMVQRAQSPRSSISRPSDGL